VVDADTGCQLYAVVEAGEAAPERLKAALDAAAIASVLIVAAQGRVLDANAAKPLVEAAQRGGAAALLAGDARLARALGADGVHLAGVANLAEAYTEARGIVGSDVVGIDPGISRHDAMTLAEAGADYVAFGAPAHLKDRDKARLRRDELVAWWAEIFQVPCVALDAETADEAQALAEAGADFVGLRLGSGMAPASAGDLALAFAAAVRERAAAD
jgi:thiamine-phosphate pyrophosphorylase